MAGSSASPARGKARESGGTLTRAFAVAAVLTAIPFLLLIAYLVWGQISREHSGIEREAFAQASLLSDQVEKHLGARIEALAGAATLLGASGGSPAAAEAQGRRLRQAFPDVDRVVLFDELGVAVAAVPSLGEASAWPSGIRISSSGRPRPRIHSWHPVAGRSGSRGDLHAGPGERGAAARGAGAGPPPEAHPGSPRRAEPRVRQRGRPRHGPRDRRRAAAIALPHVERRQPRRLR